MPPTPTLTDRPILRRLVTRSIQRYWRMSRGLTLGAQGLLIDRTDRILLVRHGYRPGWHFPGGGVEKGEPVEAALERELREEAGILLAGRPHLFGIYDNSRLFPGDHVVLYVCRAFEQPNPPGPNREIAEHAFFARKDLPADTVAPAVERLAEVLDGVAPSRVW